MELVEKSENNITSQMSSSVNRIKNTDIFTSTPCTCKSFVIIRRVMKKEPIIYFEMCKTEID